MKNIITIIFLAFHSMSGFCWSATNISSTIDKVTVYPNGAAVHRIATTAVQQGNTTIVIKNLPLNVDKTSLNIWLPKGIFLLSEKFHQEYIDVATLEEAHTIRLRQVRDSIMLIDLRSQTLQGQEYILNENRKLIEKENGMGIEELMQLNEFYGKEMLQLKKGLFQLSVQKRALEEQLTKLTAQYKQDNQKNQKREGQLLLEINAEVAQAITIKFNYFIADAGWTPNYDLRVTGTQANLQIIYKADVFQNTGEDWEKIHLSLSTAEPVLDYTLPKLQPYYLNFNNFYSKRHSNDFLPVSGLVRGRVVEEDTNEPLIGASVIIKGTTIGTSTNLDGEFQLNIPTGSKYLSINYVGFADKDIPIDNRNLFVALSGGVQLDEVVVTGYGSRSRQRDNYRNEKKEQQAIPTAITRSRTSFTYDIDVPYSILSTTNTKTVIIKTATVPATFEYITMPKITETAFLTAKIDNWQSLNLLSGEANIFLDNKYAGKTFLESDPLEESYVLSLGKDDEVIVQRTLQKDYERKRFIGNNIQETRKWQLLIKNNKSTAINIRILDQYPISKNNAIKIDVTNISNAKNQKNEGLLTWMTKLSPTKQWSGVVEYQVKYPKSKRLIVD